MLQRVTLIKRDYASTGLSPTLDSVNEELIGEENGSWGIGWIANTNSKITNAIPWVRSRFDTIEEPRA
jgi:hypothetical protein